MQLSQSSEITQIIRGLSPAANHPQYYLFNHTTILFRPVTQLQGDGNNPV